MKKEYLIYAAVIAGFLFYLYYLFGQIKITVDFKELEPFKHSLPVYYKGFKLGHTIKVYPGKDYQTTRVDLKLRLKKLELPVNTTAMVKRKDKKDYIELVYPNAPYIEVLKNHSVISGDKGLNFESFFQDQIKNGGFDEIKDNVNGTVESAGKTFDALTDMIKVCTGILEDIRPTINDTVININTASRNLADASFNVRSSLQEGYIDNTLYNLQKTSRNLELTTRNVTGITGNFNDKSVSLINCILRNVNIVVGNINEIIIGIGNTLKKRFGGLRLIFGKTVSTK